MARKINFALEMSDGTLVSVLEDLKNHIKNNDDVKKLVEYYLDGRLEKWLLDRYHEEEAKALQSVDKDDPDFALKLCKAIGVNYTPKESVNIELIEYEKKMRKALEEVTLDSEMISNAGSTACNQSDLVFLLKNGKKTIYLWGNSFKLFVAKNISYIGILGKPSVDIGLPDLESIKSYGIKLENVSLLEKFNEEAGRGAEEEARINPFKVGDYVKFGNYFFYKYDSTPEKIIEWRVLAVENNKILVISCYGLEAKRFDSSSNVWANSEIRQWLNNEFYNQAFTDQEKKFIISSNLSDVGTTDNMFLLSKGEAEKYFANDKARRCKASPYLQHNLGGLARGDVDYRWWLRSPYVFYDNYAFLVDDNGCDVICEKVDCSWVVRPAMWIKL